MSGLELGVGLAAGAVALVVAYVVASLVIEWHRLPARDGTAGILGMVVCLIVAVLGGGLGVGCVRQLAAGAAPSFWPAWGIASALLVAAGLGALVVARAFADLPPKWNGRPLELAFELRCPAGFTLPANGEQGAVSATLERSRDGGARTAGALDLARSRVEDGRVVVGGAVALDTRARHKRLDVRVGTEPELQFALDFAGTPPASAQQWSAWLPAVGTPGFGRDAQNVHGEHAAFSLRYRVQHQAGARTREDVDAEQTEREDAELRALGDAPVTAWLRFTRYGNPAERQRAAAVAMRARRGFEPEMTAAILGADDQAARDAMRALVHFESPPLELAPAVRRVGERIAAELRALHELAPDAPAREPAAAAIARTFDAWIEAAGALQGRGEVSFVPELQAIAEQSRRPPVHFVVGMEVLRVASYHLHTWAGIVPHPDDPPPRPYG